MTPSETVITNSCASAMTGSKAPFHVQTRELLLVAQPSSGKQRQVQDTNRENNPEIPGKNRGADGAPHSPAPTDAQGRIAADFS